jgi:cysteine synthase A
VGELGSSIAAFCTGVGSAASLRGVGAAVRKVNSAARVVALEPAGSPTISGGTRSEFKLQGWSGFVPPLYRPDEVDDVLMVGEEEALEMTLRLAREEGIFTGVSGGANVMGALLVGDRLRAGEAVVTLAPDSGYKYLAGEPFA